MKFAGKWMVLKTIKPQNKNVPHILVFVDNSLKANISVDISIKSLDMCVMPNKHRG